MCCAVCCSNASCAASSPPHVPPPPRLQLPLDKLPSLALVLTDEDVRAAALARQKPGKDPRARVLGVDDLLDLLEGRAAKAAADAEAQGIGRVSERLRAAAPGGRALAGASCWPAVALSSANVW